MKFIFVSLITLILSGCVSSTYVNQSENVDASTAGVLVMGVEVVDPPFRGLLNGDYSPSVDLGKVTIKNGIASNFVWVTYSASIVDNYAVFSLPQLKDNESYTLLSYKGNPMASPGIGFNCYGSSGDLFTIKSGDVRYIGDYKLFGFERTFFSGIKWKLSKTNNFKMARQYLAKNYPELSDSLHGDEVEEEIINLGGGCS
jgi:hypothetical protein